MSDLIVQEPVSNLPVDNSPVSVMLRAINSGASLEQVEKMMDLQDRWDKAQAKKAYDTAFAAFKAEAVTIIKGKTVTDGPLKGKSYDELHDVVNAVTPALSKHGLSSWWRLTKDEPAWMEVTCYLRHVSGHEESVSMGGPPDAGGAKNPIQARASTKTYLERYTLKGITGLSSQNDDTDGNAERVDPVVSVVQAKRLEHLLSKCSPKAQSAFAKLHGSAQEVLKSQYDTVAAMLEGSAAKASEAAPDA